MILLNPRARKPRSPFTLSLSGRYNKQRKQHCHGGEEFDVHDFPSEFGTYIFLNILVIVSASITSMSTSFSDLTIFSVVVLYFWKCGVLRCDS